MPRLVRPLLPVGSINGVRQPELQVDSDLLLRPWSLDDASVVVTAYGDPEIQRWMPYSYDVTEASAVIEGWNREWQDETGGCWAVAKKSSGDVVGRLAFRSIDLISGSAELAYWVLPSFRNAGVAKRSIEALSTWAFKALGLHRLELHHSVYNVASCRVALSCNFEIEGILRESELHFDGWHDAHVHARVDM